MIVPGKIHEVTLKKPKVNIHCLTDIHVGSKAFDRMLFLKVVDKIKKDPNAVWFGNGDMLEFIPPNYHITGAGRPAAQHLPDGTALCHWYAGQRIGQPAGQRRARRSAPAADFGQGGPRAAGAPVRACA